MITESFLESVWGYIQEILKKATARHMHNFANNLLQSCLLCNGAAGLVRQSIDGFAGFVISNTDETRTEAENLDQCSKADYTFPHILGYYEVSSVHQVPKQIFGSTNISIHQLKTGISNACKNMLNNTPSIPRKWLNLHQVILKRVEDHYPIINYQTFAELAIKCGFEHSEEELFPFLRHFHSCGELLYYYEVDELCDVIILDPQWLSNQLRTIVSFRDIDLNEGMIQHSQLESLWSHLELSYREKLLSLFRQAGVFIPFTHDSDLIPCRLPFGRPSENVWPRYPKTTENQVDYYLQFDNLPPSFFSHLISLVETKRIEFAGKMKPLYYNNHIVYITKSAGIPCDVHTKNGSLKTKGRELLAAGLNLARFLSVDPSSLGSLMDGNLSQTHFNKEDESNATAIDYDDEKKSARYRVHFELFPHLKAVTLSIRGSNPCCLAPQTIDLLNRILLTRYEGTHMEFYVLCPVCVRKSLIEPSKFTLAEMEHYDPVCEKGHDLIDWVSVMTGKCDYVAEVTSEDILMNLNDSECPKLFVLIPVNLHSVGLREFCALTYLKEGYSVHLLCEYPNCWHFLSSPGYRLNRPKDFFKKYGSRMRVLLRVLASLETPTRVVSAVIEPLSNLADCLASLNKLADGLDMHLTDFKENCSFESVSDDIQYLEKSEGLQRREFRKFLNRADEENRFGDLIPTFVKGKVLWVCEEHYKLEKVH